MSFTCRRGHYSVSDDYCDVCGARNWDAGQRMSVGVAPVATPSPALARAAEPCPLCSTLREGGDRYCPNCAYDFETGEAWEVGPPAPAAAPAAAGPQASLVLVVSVDASRSNERGCPAPPGDAADHVFIVDGPSTVIGRDETAGVQVPIPIDPYVSRRHAEIVDLGGQWGIRDLGSTNGTKHNGSTLSGTEVRLLRPNDVVEVGCFTKLTVRERTTSSK
jgi:hypothetical protein